MINQLKTLVLFSWAMPPIQLKKLTVIQNFLILRRKYFIIIIVNILLHKDLISQLTADNFAARLVQRKLVTKDDIADLVKEANFDNKLKNINKEVASNKAKHVKAEILLTKNI